MITYKRKRNREISHVRNATNGGHQEDQPGETQSVGFRLLDLPSCIIIEILKKMQTKEVLQCRCTCKILCQLIFDRSFNTHFLFRPPAFSLVYGLPLSKIYFTRIEADEFKAAKTLDHVSIRQIPQKDDLELVGSSKGFLCLWNKSSNANILYVTNPLLGESAILPKPLDEKYVAIDETYWFGYIPVMGIFKVIRVRVRKALLRSNPRIYHNKSEVQILAIGSDNVWKYAGDAPFPKQGKFCKTILNGYLHWIVDDDKDSLQLHSFNMEEDRGHSFTPPPKLGSACSFVELGVVGNHLGLIGCSSDRQYIEIWCMKDYGVSSSWARCMIFTIVPEVFLVNPETFWIGERLKFLWYYGLLLSYDSKDKKYTGCSNLGSTRKADAWIYTPSFLSLSHLCLGSRLRVKSTKSYLP